MEQPAQRIAVPPADPTVSVAAPGFALPGRTRASTKPKSVWPLVAVLAVFCLAIFGLLFAGSLELDRFARDQSRTLAETAVAKAKADVAFVARDYGFWDAALENLVIHPDPAWADSNVGTYAWEELGMSRTLVLGRDDKPLYSMKDGETSSDEALFPIAPVLLRLAERARETSWEDPRAISSFASLDGRIFIVSASVVTPEEPSPAEIGAYKRGVLIFMRVLNSERLEEISASYLLKELTLRSTDAAGDIDSLPLLDDRGDAVAYLGWKTPTPGHAFLIQTAPWVAAILLVLAGLTVVALKRAYAQAATVERLNEELVQRSGELERSQGELLAALEEAVQANKAKADFLAVMSHELRTPLNAVIGFSDLIRNQAFGPVGHKKYLEYGNDIHMSGQHLLSLITDILDITRANAGTLALDRRPTEMSALTSRCLTIVTPHAVRRRIAVDVVDSNETCVVMGDEVRLTQILTNLLSNAIKSSEEGSRIRIRLSPEAKEIVLRIIDAGCGIPKDDIPFVTEPFRQATSLQNDFNPYSSDHAGAGLGLAIVKRLTEAHGGRLHIASKVGLGTVVEVRLPRAAATEQSAGNRAAG